MEFLPPPIEGWRTPPPEEGPYRTHDWSIDDTDILVCLELFGPFSKVPIVPRQNPHLLIKRFDWDKIAHSFNFVTGHTLTPNALKSRMASLRDLTNRSAKHKDRVLIWEAKKRSDPEVLVILAQAELDHDRLGMPEDSKFGDADVDMVIGEGTLVESAENPSEIGEVKPEPSQQTSMEPADFGAESSEQIPTESAEFAAGLSGYRSAE